MSTSWNINKLVWGWYIFILLIITNSSNQDQVFLRVLWWSRGWNSALSLLWPGFSLWSGNWDPILWAMWCSPAAAKSLQSCLTLCDPIDGSPPGFPTPGILQARTLEWVAISFSNAWKWKVKVMLLGRVRLLATSWTTAYQAPPSMRFSRQEYWSGVPLPSPVVQPTTPKKRSRVLD